MYVRRFNHHFPIELYDILIHLFVDHGQRSINCHYANESVCMRLCECVIDCRHDERKQSIRKWKRIAFWQLLCAPAHSARARSLKHVRRNGSEYEKKICLSWKKKHQRSNVVSVYCVLSEKDRESIWIGMQLNKLFGLRQSIIITSDAVFLLVRTFSPPFLHLFLPIMG